MSSSFSPKDAKRLQTVGNVEFLLDIRQEESPAREQRVDNPCIDASLIAGVRFLP